MSLKQFFSLNNESKISSILKSQLTEIDQSIASEQIEAAIATMQKIVQALAMTQETLLNDKTMREAIGLIRAKFKVMQATIPDAGIVIAHAAFLQQLGLYEESHDHLVKISDRDEAYPLNIAVSDAQAVQISDLLAKIYLRNGAIPGARHAAKQALNINPQHAPALLVLALCQRADLHNAHAKAAEKTWLNPFAYLTENDAEAFGFLGIKTEDIPLYLRCTEQMEDQSPSKAIALCETSFAMSSFRFLTMLNKGSKRAALLRNRSEAVAVHVDKPRRSGK